MLGPVMVNVSKSSRICNINRANEIWNFCRNNFWAALVSYLTDVVVERADIDLAAPRDWVLTGEVGAVLARGGAAAHGHCRENLNNTFNISMGIDKKSNAENCIFKILSVKLCQKMATEHFKFQGRVQSTAV